MIPLFFTGWAFQVKTFIRPIIFLYFLGFFCSFSVFSLVNFYGTKEFLNG